MRASRSVLLEEKQSHQDGRGQNSAMGEDPIGGLGRGDGDTGSYTCAGSLTMIQPRQDLDVRRTPRRTGRRSNQADWQIKRSALGVSKLHGLDGIGA